MTWMFSTLHTEILLAEYRELVSSKSLLDTASRYIKSLLGATG